MPPFPFPNRPSAKSMSRPNASMSPKIAIVGCGALGCFYGARLARVGLDVHFLLRSDFDAVRDHGVRVVSVEGTFSARPRAALDPADVGP